MSALNGNGLRELRIYDFDGRLTRIDIGDTDGDGMPDTWETLYGLNPNNASDASSDPDNDGLPNLREYQAGTDPLNPDSDSDGLQDGQDSVPTISSLGWLVPILRTLE